MIVKYSSLFFLLCDKLTRFVLVTRMSSIVQVFAPHVKSKQIIFNFIITLDIPCLAKLTVGNSSNLSMEGVKIPLIRLKQKLTELNRSISHIE